MCQGLGAIPVDIEYFDPVRIAIKQAEDQWPVDVHTSVLPAFLFGARTKETLGREIWIAFALWRCQRTKTHRKSNPYSDQYAFADGIVS